MNRQENGSFFSFAAPVKMPTGELAGAIGLAVEPALALKQGVNLFVERIVESARALSDLL